MRLVVMNCDSSGPRAAQVIAGEGLQRIQRKLIVGALDAHRDALAGPEQARRRDNRNA